VEASNDDYKSGDFDEYGEVDFFAEGAESPAAVLEEISDAVASGDPEEVAAQLPSDQGQAAVVFQDAAEQLLSESTFSDDGDSGSFDRNRWKLGRTQTHTEKGPNGTTRLVIDSGKADVVDDDGDKYARRLRRLEAVRQGAGRRSGMRQRAHGRKPATKMAGAPTLPSAPITQRYSVTLHPC
jgi:hypothetical protein